MNNKVKKSHKVIASILMLTFVSVFLTTGINAATEDEIEESINAGIAWLAANQNTEGSWGTFESYKTAETCFALIKLQDRAYELGYESPFDPAYEYYPNVIEGWDYIFEIATLDPVRVC